MTQTKVFCYRTPERLPDHYQFSSSDRANLMDYVITCSYIPKRLPGNHPRPCVSSEYVLNKYSYKQKPQFTSQSASPSSSIDLKKN